MHLASISPFFRLYLPCISPISRRSPQAAGLPSGALRVARVMATEQQLVSHTYGLKVRVVRVRVRVRVWVSGPTSRADPNPNPKPDPNPTFNPIKGTVDVVLAAEVLDPHGTPTHQVPLELGLGLGLP